MPLLPGKKNIVHSGHPRDQAIAAALRMARKPRADGGSIAHSGPIHFGVPGRTDRIPIHVLAGSYVLPADLVSGLGEGNTLAGTEIIEAMFSGREGPYGIPVGRAEGGRTRSRETVPIVAAGGEYVLTPEQVAMVGDGDIDLGHAALDEFVKTQRKTLVKTLRNLPGPARD